MVKPVRLDKTAGAIALRLGFPQSAPIGRQQDFKRLRTSAGLVVPALAALALAGCVGAPVSGSLESAALNTPDTPTIVTDVTAPGEDGVAFDAPTLAAVPIPVRSPGSDSMLASGETLALIPQETAPAAAAASQAVNVTVADTAGADAIPAAAAASDPLALPATAAEPQETGTTAVAALEPAATAPAAQPNVIDTTRAPAKAAATAKPVGGLFGLFAQRRPVEPRPAAKTGGNLQTASLGPSAGTATSTAGLPGVQRQSAIFGINEDGDAADDNAAPEDNIQLASAGSLGRLLSPTGLILQTPQVEVGCFKPELLAVLKKVEQRYGKRVMVTSGYRSPNRNRRAGGVSNSTHIYCKAADIQVEGVSKWDLAKYLRTMPGRGGVGTYCRTESVHIDVGSQRDWHHPCRRSGSRSKKRT